jgi:hypothetical protein
MAKLQMLLPEVKIYPTGSRYVCSPPVLTTDIDFLVLSEKNIANQLHTLKYHTRGPDYEAGIGNQWNFQTYRRGVINLIVTNSSEFILRHVVATHLCKRENLRLKDARVLVHRVIRDDWDFNPQDYGPLNQAYGLPPSLIETLTMFNKSNVVTLCRIYAARYDLIF